MNEIVAAKFRATRASPRAGRVRSGQQ